MSFSLSQVKQSLCCQTANQFTSQFFCQVDHAAWYCSHILYFFCVLCFVCPNSQNTFISVSCLFPLTSMVCQFDVFTDKLKRLHVLLKDQILFNDEKNRFSLCQFDVYFTDTSKAVIVLPDCKSSCQSV